MDFEKPIPPAEKEPPVLSLEEIKSQLKKFVKKESLETPRILEDEKGIYFYEVSEIDSEGDLSVYSYRRKGSYTEFTSPTVIDVVHYTGSGEEAFPCGGTTLSDYDEETNAWIDS